MKRKIKEKLKLKIEMFFDAVIEIFLSLTTTPQGIVVLLSLIAVILSILCVCEVI